jgi:hypothetical protein
MLKLAGILLVFFLRIGVGMAQESCSAFLSPFVDGTAKERLLHIAGLHTKGKAAIPMLLPEIENGKIAPLGLADPSLSSYVPHPTYCGIIAAYLLELTLSKDTLPSQHADGGLMNKLIEFGVGDYIFPLGHITKMRSDRYIRRGELPKIAKLYFAWWNANSGKSLELLRDDWRKGKRPLTGSDYRWR